jgi:hypothetical protein
MFFVGERVISPLTTNKSKTAAARSTPTIIRNCIIIQTSIIAATCNDKFQNFAAMILAKIVFILTVWLIHANSFSIVPPGPQRTKPCCIRELRLCSQTDDTDASKATYDNHPFVGKIGSIPYHRLDVKSDGMLNDESTAEKLTEWVLGNDLKNVWVVSHGWNTPPEYTWQNFKGLFQQVERHLQQNNHGSMLKQFGVIGITWNSVTKDDPLVQLEEYRKEFPEDDKEVEEIKKKIEDLLDLGQDYDGILDYDNNNLAWDSVENLGQN